MDSKQSSRSQLTRQRKKGYRRPNDMEKPEPQTDRIWRRIGKTSGPRICDCAIKHVGPTSQKTIQLLHRLKKALNNEKNINVITHASSSWKACWRNRSRNHKGCSKWPTNDTRKTRSHSQRKANRPKQQKIGCSPQRENPSQLQSIGTWQKRQKSPTLKLNQENISPRTDPNTVESPKRNQSSTH